MNSSVSLPAAYPVLLVAGASFGIAIAFNNGAYADVAIPFLVSAILSLAVLYVSSVVRRPLPSLDGEAFAPTVLGLLLLSALWAWNDEHLLLYPQQPFTHGKTAQLVSALLLVSYVPSLLAVREHRWLARSRFALFAVLTFYVGVLTIHTSSRPWIDVWTIQQQASDLVLHGKNPYTSVHGADTTPGMVGLDVPYVYAPLQIFAALPGYALAKDVRFTMLAMLIVSGVAMRTLARKAEGRLPALILDAPALLLWLSPKTFFIIEQAWVDTVCLGLLGVGLVLFYEKKRMVGAVLLGFAVASKQSNAWLVPLLGFLLGFRPTEWLAFFVAAAATAVPFLGSPKALKYALFDFLSTRPPRTDSLTLVNFLNRRFHTTGTGGAAFPLAALLTAVSCWRSRRTRESLGLAMTFVFVVFFAFNRWAHANYYYFVVGLAGYAASLTVAEAAERVET